jgi:hypothetical protein
VSDQVILWRRLDQPGHEAARLSFQDPSWQLTGSAVFAEQQQPCRLDYRLVCDATWQTRSATVSGWVGHRKIAIEVAVDSVQRWWVNGTECPGVAGCIDLDLNFSPVTNMLPIRRLELAVGQATEVRAAWLRFPSFALEPLRQTYRRIAVATYRYGAGGGTFVRDLTVNAAGFVTSYPDFWECEAAPK